MMNLQPDKSPNPYQYPTKHFSPYHKPMLSAGDDVSKRLLFGGNVPPSVTTNHSQKMCLPNSIFFNQTQKAPTGNNILSSGAVSVSNKLLAQNQI